MQRQVIFLILLLFFPTLLSAKHEPDELLSLSLKELMNIPFAEREDKQRIFQPKNNPMGEDSINFAIISPISSYPLYGTELVAAVDLAADFVNANGGIHGKRLVMLRGDDEENTPVSAQIAKELVEKYQVQALIGPATSDSTADILEQVVLPYKVPLITQAASSIQLQKIAGGRNFWQMVADNNQQVQLMMNFIHGQLGHRKIFVIAGRDIYSDEITNGIVRYVAQHPGTSVDQIKISKLVYLEGMDLTSEINRMRRQGVTAVIITLPTAQMVAMIRKLQSYWPEPWPLIMAADTIKPIDLINARFGDAKHCIYTYVSSPEELAPELKEKINARLESEVTGFDAAYVYDATIILAMAKKVSLALNIDMDSAVKSITADGFEVRAKDFKNIVELFKKHRKLSFVGYSGRVRFNDSGDNITANMKIYPLVNQPAPSNVCLVPEKQ